MMHLINNLVDIIYILARSMVPTVDNKHVSMWIGDLAVGRTLRCASPPQSTRSACLPPQSPEHYVTKKKGLNSKYHLFMELLGLHLLVVDIQNYGVNVYFVEDLGHQLLWGENKLFTFSQFLRVNPESVA